MSEPRVEGLKKAVELSDWEEKLTSSIAEKIVQSPRFAEIIQTELQSLADRMESNQLDLNTGLLNAAKAAVQTRS